MLVRINDNFYVNPDSICFVEKREDCVLLGYPGGNFGTVRPNDDSTTVDEVYAFIKKQLGAKK